MNRGGRPLRFLGAVMGGWIAMRVVILWPTVDSLPDLIDGLVPAVAAAAPDDPAPMIVRSPATPPPAIVAATAPRGHPPLPGAPPHRRPAVQLALAGMIRMGEAQDDQSAATGLPLAAPLGRVTALLPNDATGRRRWSASGWLVARPGNGTGSAFGGSQLGGSQAGARIAYALGRSRRVALTGRVSSALDGTGREAAVGVAWQPTQLPVRFVAEQRIALGDGRGGPTLGMIGGVGPQPLGAGFDLAAYGQAGAIARDRLEGFADGAARIGHRVARIGAVAVDLGAGAWGAAQRGAHRLDLGPSLAADVPLGATAHVRVALDWRQRIAGNAAPGSGPALSLGTDF